MTYHGVGVPLVLSVLADETRWRILSEIGDTDLSASALAGLLPVSRQAIAKHLAVLSDAGLVESVRAGRGDPLSGGRLATRRTRRRTGGDRSPLGPTTGGDQAPRRSCGLTTSPDGLPTAGAGNSPSSEPSDGRDMHQHPSHLRHDDATVRDAVRFSVLVTALGVGFLIVASVWVSTCGGSTADGVACGAPQRTLLALAAPTILLVGGLRAFVRTYRHWRANQTWVAWQGAGWFLLSVTMIVLTTSLAPLIGP